jgi:hypothetical protein
VGARWWLAVLAMVSWGCTSTQSLSHPVTLDEVEMIHDRAEGRPLELEYLPTAVPAAGGGDTGPRPQALQRVYGSTMAHLSGVETDGTLVFRAPSGEAAPIPGTSLRAIVIRNHAHGALQGLGYGFLGGALAGVVFGLVVGAADPCSGSGYSICFSPGVLAVAAGLEFGLLAALVGVTVGAISGSEERFQLNN